MARIAHLSDIHFGAHDPRIVDAATAWLEERRPDLVIISGDLTQRARVEQFRAASAWLNRLRAAGLKLLVIPGNHDTKWSESGCTKFKELWGDDKFVFNFNNTRHIGINSGIPWRGGGGHVSVEDLDWLKNVLKETSPEREIIFYIHHPLDGDVDNWFEVTNILADYNIKAIFIGHGHANMLMNFAGIPSAMGRSTLSEQKLPGYTLIDIEKDSLKLFEVKVDSIPQIWGSIPRDKRNQVTKVDSLQFIRHSNKAQILWKKDLKKSSRILPISIFLTTNRSLTLKIWDSLLKKPHPRMKFRKKRRLFLSKRPIRIFRSMRCPL